MTGVEAPDASVGQQPNGAWYVVFVLFAAAILSYLDRGIVNIVIPDLKRSLGLSEVEVSIIQGFSFSLFFAGGGLIIGGLVDRFNRKLIIVLGIAGWCTMTILCGLAQNFEQLFAARAGVGIGEACLSPAAYSIISDLFSPQRRGRPMGVMVTATSVGGATALLLGGAIIKGLGGSGYVDIPLIGAIEVWRFTFIILGAPGLLLVLLVLTIREPARLARPSDLVHGSSYTRFMLNHWRVFLPLNLMIGLTFGISHVVTSWAPTAFIRTFGHNPGDAGMISGLIMIPTSIGGALFGGFLGDWIARRERPYGRLRSWFFGTSPAIVGALLAVLGPEWLYISGLLIILMTGGVFASLSYPALYDVIPKQFRGRAIAVLLVFGNVVGLGGGVTLVAVITQHVFRDDLMARQSMALVAALMAGITPLLALSMLRPYEALRLQNDGASPTIR